MFLRVVLATLSMGVLGVAASVNAAAQPGENGPVAADPASYASIGMFGDPGYFFRSPTAGIVCGMLLFPDAERNVAVNCYAPNALPLAAQHVGCEAAPDGRWGLGVGPDGARETCESGSHRWANRFTAATELPYDTSLAVNGYICTSARTGVTCTHDATGHGFEIARETKRLF
ncbi:hypothetical protein JMUB6875_28900 [Nocardia sp. JMUB6875]|uniref:hypothetical protein n=1 Tax=Nocardia sp. JMUB6875 TaxID=3158170 RepID=UPI0032E7B48B